MERFMAGRRRRAVTVLAAAVLQLGVVAGGLAVVGAAPAAAQDPAPAPTHLSASAVSAGGDHTCFSGQLSRLIKANPALAPLLTPLRAVLLSLGL